MAMTKAWRINTFGPGVGRNGDLKSDHADLMDIMYETRNDLEDLAM